MQSPVLTQAVVALSFALLLWLLAGRHWNRRRASQLARAVHQALPALGARATIRHLGAGASGFLIEVVEPAPGIRSAQLLCLLEPRDFPLAWAWTRLMGRRDQFILRVDAQRPPQPGRIEARRPVARMGMRRLVLAATQKESPHVQVSFGVGPGEEEDIARAMQLAALLARGEVVL